MYRGYSRDINRNNEIIEELIQEPRTTYEELGDKHRVTKARIMQILQMNEMGSFKRDLRANKKKIHEEYKLHNTYYNENFLPQKRFWLNVDIREINECWVWLSGVLNGHARGCYLGVNDYARRISYALAYNDGIIEKKSYQQTCGNRLCCNPTHIKIMTNHTRLDETKVKHIKYMLMDGVRSISWIAKRFDVSPCTVQNIKSEVNWKRVTISG